MDQVTAHVEPYLPLIINAVKALIFLVVGYIVANMVSSFIKRRIVTNPRIDDTLGGFFSSIAKWLILTVVIIAVLQLFGFQATSLVAVLGAATLAIGLALQGTLADVSSGVMLIIFRPFKLGEYVDVGGTAGTVKDLNLFFTELATPGFEEKAALYMEAMGGRDAIIEKARAAIDDGDYGWAMEILTHPIRVDHQDTDGRALKAEAMRQWAYLQPNIYWRGLALGGALELEDRLDYSRVWNFAAPDIIKALPPDAIIESARTGMRIFNRSEKLRMFHEKIAG